MKTSNSLKVLALIALLTLGVNWGATNVSAQTQTTGINKVEDINRDDPFFHTGMFGITQNQTARLNIANLDDGSFVPCVRVELSFVDRDGNIVSQKIYEIDSGKSAFLDLKGSEIVGRDSKRAQLRATVKLVDLPDLRTYMWTPTLEVFDNESGETRFLLRAVQRVQEAQRTNNEDK